MFTGIIEEVGKVTSVQRMGGGLRLAVDAAFSTALHVDQSVSVNGVCQTVVKTHRQRFEVVAIEETLRKTTLGQLDAGTAVNLERAMLPTSRLDGHLVQGHVDTTARIVSVERLETSWVVTIAYTPEFGRYLIPVGSIAVDGISLTVASLDDATFSVAIIPHTFSHTNASSWTADKAVNLEFDLIGKYVARQLAFTGEAGARPADISEAWLREKGY